MIRQFFATFTLLLLFSNSSYAQDSLQETMFQSGKIYTFLAVALVVLAGIFIYLFRLDKRLDKLETELNERTNK